MRIKWRNKKILAKIKTHPLFDTKEEVYVFLKERNMRIGPTEATVLNMVEKEEKHASPLLFSLSNLQILMNKKI